MAPTKVDKLEKVVENLQKDVQKISTLEGDVREVKKQLRKLDVMEKQMGKLDVLERLEKRLLMEDRKSWAAEKKPEDEIQVSGVETSTIEGSHLGFTLNQSPLVVPAIPLEHNE
ncbi:unnamed protein product [Arabidopsis thaliana]|uniref:Uncharacterized protein n=1 Tax=Arabidopsis thaliana TaxID=3702 RepID=A0A654EHC0_ARATH|nr:unnamed protein product [Arabidopsis thaliana]